MTISDRRKDYHDFYAHPKRRYVTTKRKPGTVWNWHRATPWWGNLRQLVNLGYERQL
jgi:hypothetical protein